MIRNVKITKVKDNLADPQSVEYFFFYVLFTSASPFHFINENKRKRKTSEYLITFIHNVTNFKFNTNS